MLEFMNRKMVATTAASRRAWLCESAAAGWALGAFETGAMAAQPQALGEQSTETFQTPPATPDEALAALYAGNRRFVDGKSLAAHRDIERV